MNMKGFINEIRGEVFDRAKITPDSMEFSWPLKIGKKWEDVILQDISEMPKKIREQDIHIGIIAVPAEAAQQVADMLVLSGVRAILNFAPARIVVPQGVRLRTADLSTQLECLSYFLTNEAAVGTEALQQNKDTKHQVLKTYRGIRE